MKRILLVCGLGIGTAFGCMDYGWLEQQSHVDYAGFESLTAEVDAYRKTRLIDARTFAEKAKDKKVIILDTRSKAAYDRIHVKGAIHLNFSDFTQEKLRKVIPDTNTCILIYCNNNVENGGPALQLKSAPLALNIPTFINLYGYGYKNIYELKSLITLNNPHITFEGTQVAATVQAQQ